MKLLLLEDDELLGETLCEELEDRDFSVTWAKDAECAAQSAYDERFDCYLFDVNVPGQNGFELLQALREAGDETPTLFLTARTHINDLKEGFEAGADDYITKPFEMDVLVIRIMAKVKLPQELRITTSASLNLQHHSLVINDHSISLPRREYEILHYYLTHKDRIIGKDEILEMLYESEFISDATFRVYIRNLNAHLEGHAKLSNVRGVGYRIESL